MDFAAHNSSMSHAMEVGTFWRYRHFMFLNSSVKGPFIPKYFPSGYHWSRAFTDSLTSTVKGVSSSIVCLPKDDAGASVLGIATGWC